MMAPKRRGDLIDLAAEIADLAAEIADLAAELADVTRSWRDICPVLWTPEQQAAYERWARRHYGPEAPRTLLRRELDEAVLSWPCLRSGTDWQPLTRQELEESGPIDEHLARWFEITAP